MGEQKGKVQTLQSRKREINDLTHGIHPPFPNKPFPWATPASQQAAQKGERRLGIGSGRRVLWLSGWPIGTYLETAPTGGGEGGSWNLEIWGKPGMYGAIADVTHSLRLSRRKAMRHDANERKARRAVV